MCASHQSHLGVYSAAQIGQCLGKTLEGFYCWMLLVTLVSCFLGESWFTRKTAHKSRDKVPGSPLQRKPFPAAALAVGAAGLEMQLVSSAGTEEPVCFEGWDCLPRSSEWPLVPAGAHQGAGVSLRVTVTQPVWFVAGLGSCGVPLSWPQVSTRKWGLEKPHSPAAAPWIKGHLFQLKCKFMWA